MALRAVSRFLLFLVAGGVFLFGLLSLLVEVVEDVLLFLGDVGEKVLGVTVVHLVFVESGYFDFVGVFAVLFLFVVHLLLELYSD